MKRTCSESNLNRGAAIIASAAETLFGLLLVLGLETRITALLSGILVVLFALAITTALGVKATLNSSVFSAARSALLLATRTDFPFTNYFGGISRGIDLLATNQRAMTNARVRT